MLLFPLLSPFWLFIFYFLHCIFHFDCFFPFFAAAFAITTLFSFYLFFQLNVDYIRPIIISFKFRIMMLLQLLHLESSIISSYLLLLFLLLSMYLLYTFIILILSLTLSFYLSISLYPSLSLSISISLFSRLLGPSQSSVREQLAIVTQISMQHGGDDIICIESKEENDRLWTLRKECLWAAMSR